MIVQFIENIGDSVIRLILGTYSFMQFLLFCLKQMFTLSNYTKASKDFWIEQVYLSSLKNLFLFIFLALLFGSIIIVITIYLAINFNILEQFGKLLVFLLINELTPIFTTAFFVLTYSLYSKEKIENLKEKNSNLVQELYVPKLVNSIFILPLISLLFISIMLSSGFVISSFYLSIDLLTYKDLIINSINLENILILVFKSSIFGFISMVTPIYFAHKRENKHEEVTKSFIKTLITIFGIVTVIEFLFVIIFY